MLILLFALACTPPQLQAAGRRVQGKGPIEQAWILADVGCFTLAERRLAAVLKTAEGQHRLHALFTRGRIAARRCAQGCADAVRKEGRAALTTVIDAAQAPGQVAIAQAMLDRLRPPTVVPPTPVASASSPAPPAIVSPPSAAPPAPAVVGAPTASRNLGLWLAAGGALVGAAATGFWTARTHEEIQQLSAARSALECGGRALKACRAAWQDSLDRARWGYAATLGLGVAGIGLGVAAWLSDETQIEAGPQGLSLRTTW